MKTCTVCKTEKTLDNFYNYKASKDGKAYRCKSCDDLARKKWIKNNPEKSQRSTRGRNLKVKYGITIEDYEKLLKDQDGKCACCGAEENTSLYGLNKTLSFAVDHCHKTNKVRGLLCNQCNRAIGMLGDTKEGVLKALEYLEKAEKTH